MRNILLLVTFVFSLFSCSSGQGELIFLNKSYQPTIGEISLLTPQFDVYVLGGLNKEAADSVSIIFYNKLLERTQSQWVHPKLVKERIEEAGLSEKYNNLLSEYQRSGVPNTFEISELGKKINSPYITICKIDQKISEAHNIDRFRKYRYIYIVLQTVSVESGSVVLEVTGQANCGSDRYDIGAFELIKLAIDEVINNYPDVLQKY